jgi:pimeloyl-ACP methyl ester carboxylesterase
VPSLSRALPAGLAAAACALLAPAATSAAVPWTPCAPTGYECTKVAVPLDHSGAQPGQIALNAVRRRAASNPSNQAVLTLAGGPGQAAVPIAESFATDLAAALPTRDLLVYDQRGTGASNPLRCTALYTASTITSAVRGCANQVGPSRAFFRTVDSVADIEALRVATGYDKLVVYGVSYGTKVALAYAAAYPTRVAALVLDSVVTPTGPDALQRSSLSTLKRVLGDLCTRTECRGVTNDAIGDVRKLARKLVTRSLRGPVISGSGRRYTARMGETGLWNILVAGDLNPTLRAEFPGSVRAALTGDVKPILRLSARAEGLVNLRHQTESVDDDDVTFFTTTCEENATIPWTRGAPEAQRAGQVAGAARALAPALTDPVSYRPALDQIPRICLGYPVAAPLPAAPGALPAVPTLIVNGLADLRTPVEDARAVQSAIPGAQLVGVPYTGHSVLGSESDDCAAKAVAAFFGGTPVQACTNFDNPFSPTPRPPLSLSRVTRQPGVPGTRGRTVAAVRLTATDARRQVIGEALAGDGTLPVRVGGLRGGYVRPTSITRSVLHRYEYVPGVRVSGVVSATGTSRLTVSGTKAAHGSLTITAAGRVTGRLGGRRVSTRLARAARHDDTGGWPSLSRALALRPRSR